MKEERKRELENVPHKLLIVNYVLGFLYSASYTYVFISPYE